MDLMIPFVREYVLLQNIVQRTLHCYVYPIFLNESYKNVKYMICSI